jgi:hypothetical protein
MEWRARNALSQMANAYNTSTLYGLPPSPGGFFTELTHRPVTLDPLKRSLEKIEAEPYSGEQMARVETKILRLLEAGADAQASVLQRELDMRRKLLQIKEWDYPILRKSTISGFNQEMTMTRDGVRVHVDPLESYVGNPDNGSEKDRLIPDDVLDSLEVAKERHLFDTMHVLWAERVPDPLLLGRVDGCEDYFFIAEWGDDITFDQLTKGEK